MIGFFTAIGSSEFIPTCRAIHAKASPSARDASQRIQCLRRCKYGAGIRREAPRNKKSPGQCRGFSLLELNADQINTWLQPGPITAKFVADAASDHADIRPGVGGDRDRRARFGVKNVRLSLSLKR